MNKKISVNVVSESDTSVQGHGVHTAYVEMVNALQQSPEVQVIEGRINEVFDVDIIHFHTIGPRIWRKLLQKGPRKVMSAHVVPDSFIGSIALARYWRFAAVWYMRKIYNRADLLLAVSKEAKSDLEGLGVTAPIEIFYNFIDTKKYETSALSRMEVRQKLHIPENAFVVIGAGQVQPRKRVDCFIAAAKALSDVHFVWVGGMPFGRAAADNMHMKKMIDSAPKNVHFPGIVRLEEMASYYKAADLFWLPSEQETFGLVAVEAAAAGLPVMLRDIPDYADTFADNAVLTDDNAAIGSIRKFQSDDVFYKVQQAKSKVLAARFDSRQAAAKLVKLYRKLL